MQSKPSINDYTIPEPPLPWVAYVLGAVVPLGLVALFIAANHAFAQVTDNWVQALLNAMLIEASAIVESLTLARARKREDYALAGVATTFSLGVSGIYNYVQAQVVGARNGVTEPWQLWPLALGPLAALAFLSLSLGRILREWEDAKAAHLADRQKWFDDATARFEQAERDAQAKRDAEQREAAERQAQAEREAQINRENAERSVKERAEKRAAALERARIRAEHPAPVETPIGIPPVAAPTTGTAIKRFGSKAEFLAFMKSANGEAPKTPDEVKALGVPHTTAYRWWHAWQEHSAPQPSAQ